MSKQVWVENKSNEVQAIQGIPAFAPKEKRRVSEQDAQTILGNSNFVESKEKEETKQPTTKKKDTK